MVLSQPDLRQAVEEGRISFEDLPSLTPPVELYSVREWHFNDPLHRLGGGITTRAQLGRVLPLPKHMEQNLAKRSQPGPFKKSFRPRIRLNLPGVHPVHTIRLVTAAPSSTYATMSNSKKSKN